MDTEISDEINLLDADIHGEQARELIERFEGNRDKNSNEIVDSIIDKEARHHKALYKKHKYDKMGVIKRKELNKYDKDQQQQRIEGL